MTVDEHIKHLMDTYGTTDPFKLADYLGIMIGYADGTSTQFKGVYCPYIQPVIVLAERYRETAYNAFYCAHELFHAIEHADNVAYYHHATAIKCKKEREANQFATRLLAQGYPIEEGTTVYRLCTACGIPLEMKDYLNKEVLK